MGERYYITEEIEIRENLIDRILSRETELAEDYTKVEKLKVGVIGIADGVGVSFIAVCLARYLANTKVHSPAVVELGRGSIFDSVGIDKRFAGREYFDFFKALDENRSVKGKKNMDEGINWVLRLPSEYEYEISIEQKLRLINNAKGSIIICDLSGCDKDHQELVQNMDITFAVIDPLPSKMLHGYQKLCDIKGLETLGHSIRYVVNKYNKGVNRREMLNFIGIKKLIYLPMVNFESIYAAEYTCKTPYSIGDIKNQINKSIKEIAECLKL